MKYFKLACLGLSSLAMVACNSDDNDSKTPSGPIVVTFANTDHGFKSIFSDYPVGEEDFYELSAEHTDIPSEGVPDDYKDKKGWKVFGNNHSDDLFMGIKAPVNGLDSGVLYKVSIQAEFLTNIQSGCAGIGGAPGESVYVKLAASTEEPINNVEDDYNRLNIDVGQQSQSGTNGLVVGDVSNGVDCGGEEAYVAKTVKTETTIDAMSNDEGQIWVLAGTDSGFEGVTSIYFTRLAITITE